MPFRSTVATSSPSSAATEFASMMEAYEHQKDNLSVLSVDQDMSNTGPDKKSDTSNIKPGPVQVTTSSANASAMSTNERTQSTEGSTTSSTEKTCSRDQLPSTTSVSSGGAIVDAPMAAAIQALAKLDISTSPTTSAMQSQSPASKEPSSGKGIAYHMQ